MKKTGLFILISLFALNFTACKEELEIWDSETVEYSGRYVFKLLDEEMTSTLIDYGSYEIRIYNTSDNLPNIVWIEDGEAVFPLKSKFTLTGDASSFKSASEDFAQLDNNIVSTEEQPKPAPTAAGQTIDVEEKEYIRASILEGKILPDAATSPGGNKTDSLYIKIKLYSGTATYTSYEVPVVLRKDPEKAEFAWKFQSATHNPDLDEVYVIGGYRYTGFPEDM